MAVNNTVHLQVAYRIMMQMQGTCRVYSLRALVFIMFVLTAAKLHQKELEADESLQMDIEWTIIGIKLTKWMS